MFPNFVSTHLDISEDVFEGRMGSMTIRDTPEVSNNYSFIPIFNVFLQSTGAPEPALASAIAGNADAASMNDVETPTVDAGPANINADRVSVNSLEIIEVPRANALDGGENVEEVGNVAEPSGRGVRRAVRRDLNHRETPYRKPKGKKARNGRK